LPLQLPQYLVDQINQFHYVKFVADVAYRDADAKLDVPRPTSERPAGYTLQLTVDSLEAPVVPYEAWATEKTVGVDCRLSISLTDPAGHAACDSGSAKTQKQKVVSVEDFQGQPAGQIWLSQTLPPFMTYFRTKKMEQMP
jgi:hypothetical protein